MESPLYSLEIWINGEKVDPDRFLCEPDGRGRFFVEVGVDWQPAGQPAQPASAPGQPAGLDQPAGIPVEDEE